ncbi:hypothetical protein HN51_007563 [Arachis hypogaea]
MLRTVSHRRCFFSSRGVSKSKRLPFIVSHVLVSASQSSHVSDLSSQFSSFFSDSSLNPLRSQVSVSNTP